MKIFKRYSELISENIKSDLHIHSTWSDGEGSVLDIVKESEAKGLNLIAITDHIRKNSTYFDDFISEIEFFRKNTDVVILAGFEAKIENFTGEVDVAIDVLRKSDLSIASVHRFPIGRKLIAARHFSPETSQEIELELSIAAIKKGGFTVLGHPGGMSISSHGKFRTEFFEEMISELCKHDIAFDYNYSYHKNFITDLKILFEKYNPLISVGSDAHKISDIGNGIKLFEHV